VRNLEQRLATIFRKIARKVVAEGASNVNVTAEDIESYLGLPSFEHEFAERSPEIGVATGLAWTSVGGEIMFIEATRMKGTGRTIVTGQLGDVMRESVQAAYSYVRSKATELEINETSFSDFDIHIHFPAGAIPKDGPSAGVAIASTIASVMGEKPVRHDVAMTGEITLRGKVLSVGGIKEKVMAAQRANIKRVVLPVGNKRDLQDVPPEVKEGLEFVFAERVEDVWREVLIPIHVARGGTRKFDQAEFDAERHRDERPENR
jgi:ATP-dependent Lon protease